MPENETTAIQKPLNINTLGKRGIGKNLDNAEKIINELDPTKVKNRIGLVCDDSGSMDGEKITNAHLAVTGFLNNCKPQETSVCIYPLNAPPKPLSCNYDLIKMYWNGIDATGGTPLYTKLKEMIEDCIKSNIMITRAVVFSDGSPNDYRLFNYGEDGNPDPVALAIVKQYTDKEIPIDTIFIGFSGEQEMRKLAELGKGIFIHFKDSSSLAQGLKYLSPGYRALLSNPEIKARIERGEKI
jgi:Mg-chelatase subunit ChlD